MLKKFLFIVSIVVVAAALFLFVWKVVAPQLASVFNAADYDYQTVFLDNGQVYFGKVDKVDSNFVYLEDVFYLQVNEKGGNPVLVEMGTAELHRPQNHVKLSRERILMIQDLKPDSQVITAIKNYRLGQQ